MSETSRRGWFGWLFGAGWKSPSRSVESVGMAVLANLNRHGQGVLQDSKEAVKWWRQAADQGNVPAQGILGYAYLKGQGVLKDYVTAYAWYSLGAFNGNEMGQENRDKLAEKMTPEQIAKAQELSRDLLKQIEENKKKAK